MTTNGPTIAVLLIAVAVIAITLTVEDQLPNDPAVPGAFSALCRFALA